MLVKNQKFKVQSSKLLFKVFILASFFLPLFSQAQCAMCRAALESEGGGVQAKAINDGIGYLMVIPYILVVVAAYGIYRIRRAKKEVKEG